jgi:hypothetical protein
MRTLLRFHSEGLSMGSVDESNCVIRNVCVLRKGEARGHGLHVDDETIRGMLESARGKAQIPCQLDHGSGVENTVGYLSDFRIQGEKLTADLFLLKSHEETPRLIEKAQRMPRAFGLSAAFAGCGEAQSGGKKAARCHDLKSVDIVTQPAATDGLFSERFPSKPSKQALARCVVMLAQKGVPLHEFALPSRFTRKMTGAEAPGGRSRDAQSGQFLPETGGGVPSPNAIHAAAGKYHSQIKARRMAAIYRAWKSGQIVLPTDPHLRID